ncbi:Phage integrase family protein [uncultured Mycobacterium sp.]|uniref:Phage integrase family protein n=1 Tax=uncultured Mycobacterium sp. TaxID=171292 RepID=A0A1Y5PAD4_9MYCO|nr:Phage integrase family protein [uncultured Mycobacterium sp.]SBS75674.1 Phage integrase family protein [uncultured Mycobacterium sp.]
MAGKTGRRGWGWLRLQGKKWSASYIGPDGIRHRAPHTFTSKLDGEGWLADERRLVEWGNWTPPAQRAAQKKAQGVTVASFAATWVEQRNLKPRTKAGYEAHVARLKESTLGPVPLGQLTPEAVRTWYAGFDKTKPTARAHAYQFLHAVCGTAVSDGLLPSNPCNIPKAMHTVTKRQAKVLDPQQLDALADAIEPKRLRMLVLLMAWCGPRWGEAAELRRKDISADCSVLTIARGATHRSGVCNIDTPKSGKGRTVVVPPHIREELKHHLNTYVAEDPDAQLFPAAQGGCHLNDRVFLDYYTAAQEAAGVDRIRIHDLRHFAGTQAARVGANLAESMARLGHSTVRASLIYQQAVSGRDAEVAAALSQLAQQSNGASDTPKA